MEILHAIIVWVGIIIKMTATYIFILMGPGIIFSVILHYLHKHVESNARDLMGKNVYLGFFGGFGTMVHEIGHAIMCVPFGHRITKMELFNPDPNTGTLGYVRHSYDPESSWAQIGNLFIGIGPILIGSSVVYFSAYYLVSEAFFDPFKNINISYANFSSFDSFKMLLVEAKNAFVQLIDSFFIRENFTDWKFWLFFYILMAVGSSMTLSPADIEGAASGFGAIVGVFIFISIGTRLFEGSIDAFWLDSITKHYSVIYAVMLLAIGFNSLILVPLFVLKKIFRG